MKKNSPSSGFTLLELMVIVCIFSILATIALPKLANAVQRAKEGTAKGNLGAIRGALAIYQADTEGRFPPDLATLTAGSRYLSEIPKAKGVADHLDSESVALGVAPTDAGGWTYNNVPSHNMYGHASINCTHADVNGRVWSAQ